MYDVYVYLSASTHSTLNSIKTTDILRVWCSSWHRITFQLILFIKLNVNVNYMAAFVCHFWQILVHVFICIFFLNSTGVLQTYHIIVRGYDANLNRSRILTNVTIDATAPTLLLANLTEGVTYTVSVAAANRAGYGPYSLPATLRLDPITKRLDQSTLSHRYVNTQTEFDTCYFISYAARFIAHKKGISFLLFRIGWCVWFDDLWAATWIFRCNILYTSNKSRNCFHNGENMHLEILRRRHAVVQLFLSRTDSPIRNYTFMDFTLEKLFSMKYSIWC